MLNKKKKKNQSTHMEPKNSKKNKQKLNKISK